MTRFTLLLFALLLSGCGPDLSGIEEASLYADELLDHTMVTSVECEATTLVVGQEVLCRARGAQGQILQHSGSTIVMWSATPDSVANITLDAVVTAVGPGSVTITAVGPKNSSAALVLTVN